MTVRKQHKLIYGVGDNDADYIQQIKETIGRREDGRLIQKVVWVCPFYRIWSGVLQRSYSENWKSKYPTYASTTCCKDWHLFSTFKRWMEQQPYEGQYLDKDILKQGNQVYCPEHCVFLPQKINSLLISCTAAQGTLPVGVTSKQGKYLARVQDGNGKRKYLGTFESPEAAHSAWQIGKADAIEVVIKGWVNESTYRQDVADSLQQRCEDLRQAAAEGVPTTFL